MQKKLILSIFIFLLVLSIANAKEPSPNTHIYFIEYEKAVKGAGAAKILNAIFFVKINSQQAEAILREELNRAINFFPPQGDIVATAWFSPTGNDIDEQQITLVDGSSQLIFSKKVNKVLTWKEYEGTKTQVQENKSDDYFTEYEENNVLVSPGKKFATLRVIFKKEISQSKAYEVLISELKRGLSNKITKWPTTAYAFIGNKSDPSSQKQIMDTDRSYIFVEYDPLTGKISKNGKVLGSVSK